MNKIKPTQLDRIEGLLILTIVLIGILISIEVIKVL